MTLRPPTRISNWPNHPTRSESNITTAKAEIIRPRHCRCPGALRAAVHRYEGREGSERGANLEVDEFRANQADGFCHRDPPTSLARTLYARLVAKKRGPGPWERAPVDRRWVSSSAYHHACKVATVNNDFIQCAGEGQSSVVCSTKNARPRRLHWRERHDPERPRSGIVSCVDRYDAPEVVIRNLRRGADPRAIAALTSELQLAQSDSPTLDLRTDMVRPLLHARTERHTNDGSANDSSPSSGERSARRG